MDCAEEEQCLSGQWGQLSVARGVGLSGRRPLWLCEEVGNQCNDAEGRKGDSPKPEDKTSIGLHMTGEVGAEPVMRRHDDNYIADRARGVTPFNP